MRYAHEALWIGVIVALLWVTWAVFAPLADDSVMLGLTAYALAAFRYNVRRAMQIGE